jgi:hypothetical protein
MTDHGAHMLDEEMRVVPCTVAEASLFSERIENRRVGYREEGERRLSTVFLMFEHHGGMFFETGYDNGEGEGIEVVERYRTWEAAVRGHARYEANWFKVDFETMLRGWPEGDGLEITVFAMAEDENGDWVMAEAANREAQHWDIAIRPADEVWEEPIWEVEGLNEEDRKAIEVRLETRLPEAVWEEL